MASQTAWSAVATGANAAFFFFLIPLITKLGGVGAYGLWEGTWLLVNLAAPLAWLGLRSGFTRYSAGLDDRATVSANFHAVMVVIVPAALLLGTCQLLAAPWIAAQIVGDAALGPAMLRIGALLVVGEALLLAVLEGYRATLRLRSYALLVLLQRGLEIGLVALLLYRDRPITECGLAVVATRTLVLALAYAGIARALGLVRPDFSRLAPYAIYGLPLLFNEVLGRMLKGADRLIVGHYLGVEAMGAYGVVVQLCLVFVLYTATLQVWLYPHLSGLWNQGERERAVRVLERALRFFWLLALPTAAGLSAIGPSLVAAMSEPAVAVRAVVVLPVVACSFAVYGVASLTLYALALVERTAVITGVLVAAAALNLVLNLLLVPRLDILGAALANAVGFGTMALLMWLAARRHLPVQLLPGGWVLPRILVACVAMAAVVAAMGPGGLLWLGATIAVAAGTYAAVLLAVRGVTPAEIRALIGR